MEVVRHQREQQDDDAGVFQPPAQEFKEVQVIPLREEDRPLVDAAVIRVQIGLSGAET